MTQFTSITYIKDLLIGRKNLHTCKTMTQYRVKAILMNQSDKYPPDAGST